MHLPSLDPARKNPTLQVKHLLSVVASEQVAQLVPQAEQVTVPGDPLTSLGIYPSNHSEQVGGVADALTHFLHPVIPLSFPLPPVLLLHRIHVSSVFINKVLSSP